MSLESFLKTMRSDLMRLDTPLLADFDEYALRSMAASFVVMAVKPHDYEDRRALIESQGPATIEAWNSALRDYYTARVELMHRHHEILLYRRWSHEKGRHDASIPEPPDLMALLQELKPVDMLNACSINAALARFRTAESELKAIRDLWISVYLRSGLQHSVHRPKQTLKRWLGLTVPARR
jgi:hypothetical protein